MLQGQLLSHSEWLSCLRMHKTQSAVVRLEEEDTRKSSRGDGILHSRGHPGFLLRVYYIV